MDENEKIDEWVRYINALQCQETKLVQLCHFPKEVRVAVLKKLKARTAEELFEVTL